jgi:putative phage-type endonuclease
VDREQFLQQRRSGIGSSDVAKILGLSRFGTALDVYLSKVNPPSQEKMAPHLEWGLRKESVIAAAITDHYGWPLTKPGAVIHREYRFLIANPDRLKAAGGENEAIEIKTSERADGWGESETDEVPDEYWLQCQHQMEVLHESYGVKVCWLFVLIGASDFRRYRIERDPKYLGDFLEPLREFWSCVENRTPPEPDWNHRSTLDAVQRLCQPIRGRAVTLDKTAQDLADEYELLGRTMSETKENRDVVKARLIATLDDAETGFLPDGRIITRKQVHRSEYTVKPTNYFDLRIKKGT